MIPHSGPDFAEIDRGLGQEESAQQYQDRRVSKTHRPSPEVPWESKLPSQPTQTSLFRNYNTKPAESSRIERNVPFKPLSFPKGHPAIN